MFEPFALKAQCIEGLDRFIRPRLPFFSLLGLEGDAASLGHPQLSKFNLEGNIWPLWTDLLRHPLLYMVEGKVVLSTKDKLGRS
jgi:hypothetical protein